MEENKRSYLYPGQNSGTYGKNMVFSTIREKSRKKKIRSTSLGTEKGTLGKKETDVGVEVKDPGHMKNAVPMHYRSPVNL